MLRLSAYPDSSQPCLNRTPLRSSLEPWPEGESFGNTQRVEGAESSPDNFADQWVDQKISISDYSLSASVACGKFCCAMVSRAMSLAQAEANEQEEMWDII